MKSGMARVGVLGVLAIALCAGGAIGCGGALVADDGGAGKGGGGSAGGGSGGAGVASQDYTWAGGSIRVAPTSAVADTLIIVMEDQASSPALSGMLTFAPTGTWDPTNGAGVVAGYNCQGLDQIQLVSCANQTHRDTAAVAPGCLVAVFTADKTTGTFIHPSGATCDITAAKAILQLPPPPTMAPVDGGPPPDAAVGTYEFNCQGSDGTHLLLSGHFVLPVTSWSLLC